MAAYFNKEGFTLYKGDCRRVLKTIRGVDMIFADPPYFLSNDGQTIQNGQLVSVNKGEWDKLKGSRLRFNRQWLSAAKDALKPGGTIWISSTMHNIFSVYQVLEELDFKILNVVTWQKLNPPPNFSCRCFTASTEFIIWARKDKKKGHTFNYDLMKAMNAGKQMKDVWALPALARWEKTFAKHPTQKPLSVLARCILASTKPGDLVLDPFAGSSTTGIAAYLFNRSYIGIDMEKEYLDLSVNRYGEAVEKKDAMRKKIYGISLKEVELHENPEESGLINMK